jgi:hypothetical protein
MDSSLTAPPSFRETEVASDYRSGLIPHGMIRGSKGGWRDFEWRLASRE